MCKANKCSTHCTISPAPVLKIFEKFGGIFFWPEIRHRNLTRNVQISFGLLISLGSASLKATIPKNWSMMLYGLCNLVCVPVNLSINVYTEDCLDEPTSLILSTPKALDFPTWTQMRQPEKGTKPHKDTSHKELCGLPSVEHWWVKYTPLTCCFLVLQWLSHSTTANTLALRRKLCS